MSHTVIYNYTSHRTHSLCRTGHFKYVLLVIVGEYLLIVVPALDGYFKYNSATCIVRDIYVFSMWSENFNKTDNYVAIF